GAVEVYRETVGHQQDVLRDQPLEKRVSEQRIEEVGDRADEDGDLPRARRAPLRRRDRRRNRTSYGDPARVATVSHSFASAPRLRDKPARGGGCHLTLSGDWNGHRRQTAPR